MEIIELQSLSYAYGRGTPFEIKALDNINLKIGKNTVTGIIGHTGCGKSTLVQTLNGLIRPDSGRVLLDGVDIWEKPKEITKVRQRVGLVMQYPEYQLFDETVAADIGYGPRNMGLSAEEVKNRVYEAARYAGIDEEMLCRSPFDLSGGQKRRAAIAGIMAMRPEVLVLDEPAAGLDPRGRERILGGLREYRQNAGATVVIVSHNMEDIARFCDHIVVMSEAKIAFEGNCSDVFRRFGELAKNGLAVPAVTVIADRLREMGLPLPDDIYTVKYAAKMTAGCFGRHKEAAND